MENSINTMAVTQVQAEPLAQHLMEKAFAPKLVQGAVEVHPVGVQADREMVQKAIEEMRHHLEYANRKLEYSFHEHSNQFVVRIEDKSTGEVIREVPNAEFLDLVSRLQDMVGFVINKSA